MKILFIIWCFLFETLSIATLLLCGSYLVIKVTTYFGFEAPLVFLSYMGMGLVIFHIHDNIFKDRREKVKTALKSFQK
jgi:hypothetical protein